MQTWVSCARVTEDCHTGTGRREFIHARSAPVCLDGPYPWSPNLYQTQQSVAIGYSYYVTALAPP